MAGAVEIKDHNSKVRLALNGQGAMFVDTIAPIDVDVNNTVTVTGTVTATPTGTQAVSGTVTTVPSGTQTVAGTVTTVPSGTQTVTAVTPLPVTVTGGTVQGGYGFNTTLESGSSSAKNFIAVFNPVGSLVNLRLTGAFVSCGVVSGGSTTTLEPMRAYRITTSTSGTLQAASAIFKFLTTYPNASAEVRTANPSVTLGPSLSNSPPMVGSGALQGTVHQITQPDEPPLVLAPGEGVVLRTEAGDTDQRWNLTVTWTESLIA